MRKEAVINVNSVIEIPRKYRLPVRMTDDKDRPFLPALG